MARGAHKAAIERLLSSSAVVIADGLNYIKGFRYELHCLVRSARTTACVVWVGPSASLEDALAWNAARRSATATAAPPGSMDTPSSAAASVCGGYEDAPMRDLWLRFEAPDARNRWDAPLFRVAGPATTGASSASNARAGTAAPSAPSSAAVPATGPFFTSKFELASVYAGTDLANASAIGRPVGSSSSGTEAGRTGPASSFRRAGAGPSRIGEDDLDIADLRDFDGLEDGPDDAGAGVGGGARVSLAGPIAPTTMASQAPSSPARVGGSSFIRASPAGAAKVGGSSFRRGVSATQAQAQLKQSQAQAQALSGAPSSVPGTGGGSKTGGNESAVPEATAPLGPEPACLGAATDPASPSAPLPLSDSLLPWDEGCSAVQAAITGGKVFTPNLSVVSPAAFSTDFVFELEAKSGEVVAHLSASLGAGAGVGVGDEVAVPGSAVPLRLQRKPTIAEVKRLQRAFIKVASDSIIATNGLARGGAGGVEDDDGASRGLGLGGGVRGGAREGGGGGTGAAGSANDTTAIKRRFVDFLNAALTDG
jgi:hypothetical protein